MHPVENLSPPTAVCARGSGKHPQLMPSTPRWEVANGVGVIPSVCDDEVTRYEITTLTTVDVPVLLLPSPTTALDEHIVVELPSLELYACLFYRYYSIATTSSTLRLLLGLLAAPPSCAPDELNVAVQLVELLRAAEEYATGMRVLFNCYYKCHTETHAWVIVSTTVLGFRCTRCCGTFCGTSEDNRRICNWHEAPKKLDAFTFLVCNWDRNIHELVFSLMQHQLCFSAYFLNLRCFFLH